MTQAAQQRILDILEYWHKIEFFIPFDLSQVTDTQDDWKLRWLSRGELQDLSPDYFSQLNVPEERRITGFRLFVGVFDKAEILRSCAAALSAEQQFEQDERSDMEGRTCFARLALSAQGEPIFDPVSVSTAPWALGRAASHGLSGLGLEAFETAKMQLQDRLKNFTAQRAIAGKQNTDLPAPASLSGQDMLALADLFADWAGFTPDDGQPAILLEIVSGKKARLSQAVPPNAVGAAPLKQDDDDEEDGDEEGGEAAIEILNSFFIEDIERAMRALRNGEGSELLASYLTPLAPNQRVDLYTPAGREELIRMLHPACANRGHWLEDAQRSMSLMQQFAINAALGQLHDHGIFSVNGPPGTGKTTLLRELFAENIVRRAAALAKLERASDAFTGKQRVGFANSSDSTTISCLRSDLTGFEMVVASSNNAAVENISHDLPKSKQLGAEWGQSRYLQTVAQRLAAEDEDGNILPLPQGEQPWGLIACALGNSKNRRRFVSKFYYPNKNEEAAADPNCQNIRQWVASYQGPGFKQAVADYRLAALKVEERSAEVARCADLWTRLRGLDADTFCSEQRQALATASNADNAALLAQQQRQASLSELQGQLGELAETERLLDRAAPGFWARLLRSATARQHRTAVVENADAQRSARAAIADARRLQAACAAACAQTSAALEAATAALAERQHVWQSQQSELEALRERMDLLLPGSATDLELDRFQIHGLWQDPALAALRSALLAHALALHEAWLAEVARPQGGFGGNLFAVAKLLEGRRPDVAAHARLIWQSLFMVVPVVSTTFASLSRQFRDLDGASLGWLFIDEAGQAVPQAAVGALWRARRAVVVGDPRQIEPVFTVPLNLIRALSAQSVHTADDGYAPDKVSVQRLADDANRYGTLAVQPGTPGLWIGSPLRVHRRCADPMFSLSNAIAYEGKMVFGLKDRQPPVGLALGASAWIQLGGATAFKQVVPQQIGFAVELLVSLYARDGSLPAIYLISPFKAVKNELKKGVLAIDWKRRVPDRAAPKKKALQAWCKDMVGTVHTFQGKEQRAVIMILGADADHAGAAAWAASKPNLLNVALTRAQQHFYIVGDAAVWRALPYFSDALAILRRVDARAFIEDIV